MSKIPFILWQFRESSHKFRSVSIYQPITTWKKDRQIVISVHQEQDNKTKLTSVTDKYKKRHSNHSHQSLAKFVEFKKQTSNKEVFTRECFSYIVSCFKA